jgi:hypothetical protein
MTSVTNALNCAAQGDCVLNTGMGMKVDMAVENKAATKNHNKGFMCAGNDPPFLR